MTLYMVKRPVSASVDVVPIIYNNNTHADRFINGINFNQYKIKESLHETILTREIYEKLIDKSICKGLVEVEVEYNSDFNISNFNKDLSIRSICGSVRWQYISIGDFIFDNMEDAIKLCHLIIYKYYGTWSKTVMDYIFK